VAALIVAAALVAARIFLLHEDPLPVRVVAAERGLVEETIASTKAGAVRARRVSSTSVEAAGRIVEVHAREGARVARGDRLLSIDRRDADAALAAARTELAVLRSLAVEAQARLDDATREHDRVCGLRGNSVVSQAEVDRAQGQLEMAAAVRAACEAREKAQGAAIARAEIAAEKCELRAPFDAVVAERYVEVGEWAVPGAVAFLLLETESLYVRAELDEVDMARLVTGLPARVSLDPYRGVRLPGTVARVAPYVSEAQEQNRTVVVEVELSRPLPEGVEPRHGTSADVEVILREAAGVLRVPTLTLAQGGRVLVAAADGRARERRVRTGLRNWEFTEVLEGLAEGERVIASLESERLADGVEVRVLDAAGDGAGP
jgi:HlyD family secretion protein